MKTMVVGGAGFIGSVVTRFLRSAGHDVVVLDDCSTGHADAVPPDVELIEVDITGAADVLNGRDIDAVRHFAAKSLVGESVANPSLYWRTNVSGTRALLDAMTKSGIPRLVFSSTAAVYGEPDTAPITEDAPTRPTNTYGATKLAVDVMITGECAATNLAAVSLRCFNVAGAAFGAGERHTTETHLILVVLDAAAGVRDRLGIFGATHCQSQSRSKHRQGRPRNRSTGLNPRAIREGPSGMSNCPEICRNYMPGSNCGHVLGDTTVAVD